MSNSDDELRESRDDPSLRSRLLRGLGDLDEDSSGLVLIFLVFFAPGLALLGFGAAEGLTGSSWLGAGGALLGLCAGVALVRDFLRWRFSWSSALLELAFIALLLAPYL